MTGKKKSSHRKGSNVSTLQQLSAQLADEFPDDKFLPAFLEDADVTKLVSLHDILKKHQHNKRKIEKSNENIDKEPKPEEYITVLCEALEEIELIADSNDTAHSLYQMLTSPHLRAFVEALEDISKKNYDGERPNTASPQGDQPSESKEPAKIQSNDVASFPQGQPAAGGHTTDGGDLDLNGQLSPNGDVPPSANGMFPMENAMKMVAFVKQPNEDLGITVGVAEWQTEDGLFGVDIFVERIMANSNIEKQGVLKPGDIIREVNGVPVDSPETLQKLMRKASGNVTIKVVPAFNELPKQTQLYVRAHFSYNPENDGLLPCKEAGLRFACGEILQVLSQEDPHWWQARHWDDRGRAGLIPSVTLQERRKAFRQGAVDPEDINYKLLGCGLGRKKKKVKVTYKAKVAQDYENSDLIVYEEVARIPPFQRKVVVLLGPTGVGRHSLMQLLIKHNPELYARAIPHTSRPLRPGENPGEKYMFAGRAEMEADINRGLYLEHGEFGGHLYGIKLDTIRTLAKNGKTVFVACEPQAVKMIHTTEFMPHVIFVAAPSVDCMKAMFEYGRSMNMTNKYKRDEDFRSTVEQSIFIEKNYRHLFDWIVINDNFDVCFEQLSEHVDSLTHQHQWVPVTWLY